MNNLNDQFKNFLEKQNVSGKKVIEDVQNYCRLNPGKIDLLKNVATTLTQFAIHKTPFTLLEGAASIASSIIQGSGHSYDFLTEANGWKLLSLSNGSLNFSNIFKSVIDRLPFETIHFKETYLFNKMIDMGKYKIVVSINNDSYGDNQIYFECNKVSGDEVLNFLISEKMKDLTTNVVSFNFSEREVSFISEVIYPVQSVKSDYYTNYIKKYLDLNISRSIMFYGSPGTGKTTCCQTIISNLNYRTLKFRYSPSYDFSFFATIIKRFKIEAVMIDDFDQCDSSERLFEFLEMLKKETKLVIGLANSLQEFHPALLRPGRFDEIILIDGLDPKAVRNILGKLSEKYFEKVKKWPVAYLNELVNRSQVLTTEELDISFTELDSRVAKALENIK